MRNSDEQREVRAKGGAGNAHLSPPHPLPRNWSPLDTVLLCRGLHPPGLAFSILAFQRAMISCGGQDWNPGPGLQRPHSLLTSEGSGSWGLAAVVKGAWGAPTLPHSCALATAHLWLPWMEVTDMLGVQPCPEQNVPVARCIIVPPLEAWRVGLPVAR